MDDRPMRDLTDAEVFAALCALPFPFRFEVGRIVATEPDPEATAAMYIPLPPGMTDAGGKAVMELREQALAQSVRPRILWTVMIASEPPHGSGAAFYGRAPGLALAYGSVRAQIAALCEIL